MTDETRLIIRDALQHRERNYRGFAQCDQVDAVHCRRSDNPVVRGRAEHLEQRAADGFQKAAAVLLALQDFDSSDD